MKTPLHKKLTEYIRLHTRVLYSDIQKYAEQEECHAYTAIRRLQEVRQPTHRNYNPDIGAMDKDGNIITDTTTTIHWFVYLPAFSQTNETPPRTVETPKAEPRATQPEKPRTEVISKPQNDWRKSPEFNRPILRCCDVAIYCQDKRLPINHTGKCLNNQSNNAIK